MSRRALPTRMPILAGVLIALAIPLRGGADDWPSPQIREVFSASREWFVRVTPGSSLGETVGFAGAARGKHATAEFYRRAPDRSYRLSTEITLANPVAPVLFLVTERGYLVTFDNWHNMGYGKAIVSYAPDGRLVRAAELREIFSAAEIAGFRTSVSSIWWRTETVYVRDGQQSIHVAMDDKGSELVFEPEIGGWQHCRWKGEQHLCRSSTAPDEWGPFREPAQRK